MKNIQMVDLQNVKRFKHSSRRQNFSKSKYFTFSTGSWQGKKLYFLFCCDNISPSKAVTTRFIVSTKIIFQILQSCGLVVLLYIKVKRFLKDSFFFQSKGTFLSSLIAPIYYSYNGNLSTKFSQSLQYKQTFYELLQKKLFFCLSELRTDYFRERKRTFKHFLC